MGKQAAKVLTVALNPAIDRGIEVPDFTIGAHQIGRQVFRRAAGKAINVARVLDTLNVSVSVTGFVGRRRQGYFEKQLDGENLSCQLFALDGRTRENITIMDPQNKVDTHIRDRGFIVEPSDLAKLGKKLALLSRKDLVVCFSGSLPQGVSPEQLVELLYICQAQGASVCLDSGGSVLGACAGLKLHLIKPNFLELSEMLGRQVTGEDDVLAAADRLRQAADIALVTCGSEGGYLLCDRGLWRGKVTIDPGQVKNTVGCGDAMLGGFLAAHLSGRAIEDSYRYALAVATSAALSVIPGTIHLDRIDRLYNLAVVSPIVCE